MHAQQQKTLTKMYFVVVKQIRINHEQGP